MNENELDLYKRDLVRKLDLELSEKQITAFTIQQILGIADGNLEIHRNPTAPFGHMHEHTAPKGLPHNGHDYI